MITINFIINNNNDNLRFTTEILNCVELRFFLNLYPNNVIIVVY